MGKARGDSPPKPNKVQNARNVQKKQKLFSVKKEN